MPLKRLLAACIILTALSAAAAQTKDIKKESDMEKQKIYITINGQKVSVTLSDNSSAKSLMQKLSEGNVTYEAHDYGNFEKVGELPWSLPRNDEDITTVPGDLILYLGKNLVIYYDQNQWDFTRIGRLDGLTQQQVKDFVNAGKSNVKVTLSLE